jgi:drug/metabolite transporter (DMT)-like permease
VRPRARLSSRPGLARGGALAGIALAALGAIGFASKGVFAKLLYADGWTYDATLTTRAVLSLPVMALWALWRVGPEIFGRVPWRAAVGAAAAGALCYYGGAMLDFFALTLLDAGIERVLLFAYPSIVVLLNALLYRQLPGARVLAAVAVTYAGILLVVSGFDLDLLRANISGAGLVLGCSLTMALYYLASDRWTPALGSIRFALYALTAAATCLALHYHSQHGFTLPAWQRRDLGLMGGLVAFATVMPMLAMAESVRRLGAERAAVISTLGPPATLLLGGWLLGERLRAPQWCGVALIIGGILILELGRRSARAAAQAVAATTQA